MKAWKAALVLAGFLLINLRAAAADLVPIPELGVRLERGFRITLVADNDLAPDTWCMTLDALGRVVVANGQSIRTLADDDGDGVADRAIEFASVNRGVMGMCFDGTSLYAVADGWFVRFDDADANGVADGPPVELVPVAFGEHGGHAMRKGPDGWWYLIGGNDAGFTAATHAALESSPIRDPEAGALLRLTPDGGNSEVFAHGFRNPYDFDFNWLGDLFTYDSDVEADLFLPWYVPTRAYHIGYAQHHGWRLPGYKRSWPRPDYYTDTVPILARFGRGSPTGVTTYRHFQFPEDYRGGMFLADWTFGRINFLPLDPAGASYAVVEPEIFLEPMGTFGFAPTDLAVAPDGSLYISIGGRRTRGAVYRVEWTGTRLPLLLPPLADPDLNNVVAAAQPLDAWSRAIWVPAAVRLGAPPFAVLVSDESVPDIYRVRAIEVLTELFGGVPPVRARAAAFSTSPNVRARIAWSLGRLPGENAAELLPRLALDTEGDVRRFALDAIADRIQLIDPGALLSVVPPSLAHPDKYVRLAAARVASLMGDDAWVRLTTDLPRTTGAVNLGALAQVWRNPDAKVHPEILPALTNLVANNRDPFVRLEATRMFIRALGGWHLHNPSMEVNTAYEFPVPVAPELNPAALRNAARSMVPSGNALLDAEASRLLAMLEDPDRRTPVTLMNFITPNTTATSDFHFLACLARVRGPTAELAPRVASAILALDRKLGGQAARVKQNWNARLVEVAQQLIRREPAIGDALVRSPQLFTPSHVFLANAFEGERKLAIARRFLSVVRTDTAFPWTADLVALLALLPAEEVLPLYRARWPQITAREEILPRLAAQPTAADRPKFLAGLGSAQPSIVRTSVVALLKLPPDPSGTNLVAPLKLLHRLASEPAERPLRAQVTMLITNSLKVAFRITEPDSPDPAALRRAYQPIFDYVGAKYPGVLRAMNAEDNDDPVRWNAFWRGVNWENGDPERGEQIFVARACASCHRAEGQIGPDLAGAAQRFAPADLMNAVVFPSREIAPPYRTTAFRLRNGEVYTGMVAFESADGWIVHTGQGSTVRINATDVVSRQSSSISLMPSGLFHGIRPQEVADLFAYLRTLQAR